MLLLRAELNTLRNVMPLCQTATTTGGGGMLSDKHRMTAHGRLFPVIGGMGRCKTPGNKIGGVLVNGFGTFVPAVLPFLRA